MRPLRGIFARVRVIARGFVRCTAICGVLGSTTFAPPVHGIVGVEGTFEYAIDAPWRIEPGAIRDGSPIYGAIPIQISIHDANLLGLDRDNLPDLHDLRLGRVCSVVVRERISPDGPGDPPTGPSKLFPFASLDEIEYTRGRWPAPGDPDQNIPEHGLCRAWAGEDCSGFDRVGGSSEWHGSLAYLPSDVVPGASRSLQIEVRLTKDPLSSCEIIPEYNLIRLMNEVLVYFAPTALPRFDAGWLYGDLHYHAQGTDNEGESAYNYRGVLRAMGAIGMDFAFATEHASNSEQIVDVDAKLGSITDFTFPPSETRAGLRDMSRARFRFLHDLLNLGGGANPEAALITSAGEAEPAVRMRPVPRIFLGGEVDLIPELRPGTVFGDLVPWGNEQQWSTDNLCFGTILSIGPIDLDCDFLGIHLLEQTATNPDAVLVDDIQGFSIDFARHHIVYLPRRAADRDAFVRSNTGHYGGAHRRFTDLRPELEGHGYFFAAHPFSHYERTGILTDPGPTDIPWTDHLYEQVWQSPAFLGLQFWNENSRLRQSVRKWGAVTVNEPVPSAGFCTLPITNPVGQTSYICPDPGDDVGFERHDSHVIGIPTAYLPVDQPQAGFGSGVFHLDVSAPVTGLWEQVVTTTEEKLHHGAFTWDRLNHWGLDSRKTLDVPWLPSFLAPRRLFMAGGSDAHGDLNYRRAGYVIRTEAINDAALGRPRNLVKVGAPDGPAISRGPHLDPIAVHSQDQIAEALANGQFSITDGPALRIAADLDHDGAIDAGEPTMGDVVELQGSYALPLLIEWKSTTEFGPITRIDLYVGARSSEADLATSAHADGRTYAPFLAGVLHPSIPGLLSGIPLPDLVLEDPPYNRMNDNYWADPTGLLRFVPENGFAGAKSITLDLSRFPAMQNRRADRYFVRAFAITAPPVAGCDPPTEGCLARYAFTNPIWAIEKSYLCGAVAGLDTVAPSVSCNAPESISRQSLPLSFTASAEDLCGAGISVGGVECYKVNQNGTRTRRHCVVTTEADTLEIDRADGAGTIVSWVVTATDPAGNSTTIQCQSQAENSH